MAQTIDSQMLSLKVQKFLHASQEQSAQSAERIGSGLRINSAKDDASGLAIAERMNSRIRGMQVGIRNANDGISMSQIAEGGLKQVSETLQRMRELALQSANGTYTDADRAHLNAEYASLNGQISHIASTTAFNGQTVLANAGGSVSFQVGSGPDSADSVAVDTLEVMPLSGNISTQASALASVSEIDAMMADISNSQAYFGSMQSRFESTISNQRVGIENQSAAYGRIMNADTAVETALLTRSQMLEQSGVAMVSQANVSAQSVAQLLA